MSRTTVIVWMTLFGLVMTVETSSAFHQPNVAMVRQTARHPKSSQHHLDSRNSDGLHYSSTSSNDDSSSSQSRWWKTLLSPADSSALSPSSSTATASSASGEASEQETVDAYLEFLDRRYRRLHSDEEEARKRKQSTIKASNSNTKPIPFSAMDWLMNGSTSNSVSTEQQQEDALYVLGVAGLASQKLLQKHHLRSAVPPSVGDASGGAAAASKNEDAIEVFAETSPEEDDLSSLINFPSQIFIKKVLVPLIRAVYIVQRRKDQVVQRIQSTVGAFVTKAAQRVVHPVARRVRQGPKAIVESLLEIGGGRRNLTFTLACAYATVVLLRPILQAAVTEASVRP
ncbi:hypothetical protein IV203_008766 [Nitzschia inconspicua]|uniref:Uncharacterized protein n=1 Tax=Nitzschia inconspicua TaxID=303405 RepID=A0A9K3KZB5_9STRA|nr:hypothetical protein IV203_008766 [Nitzschia inconspicua]